MSPEREARMASREESGTSSRLRSADAAELVEITKRALDEAAEKQRAQLNNANIPQSWVASAGETLDLSSKGARALPVEVIELIRDRVERLALSHNSQIQLPSQISTCSRLYYLNLRWNEFTTFPEPVLNLTQLQVLDLSRNKITSIPDDLYRMTSLKFLAFTNNEVTRLPHCMGDMSSLTKLKLDDNPIEYPPPGDFIPSPEARQRAGFDSNTYVCERVKRFMRLERERQRQEEELQMSESNLETPKPLRRTNTGRFPIRVNLGSVDHGREENEGRMGDRYQILPVPQKSSARDSLVIPHIRLRPGLAPLSMQGMAPRSRSESVANGSQKLKRLGFVPSRKTSGPPSATYAQRDPAFVKAMHARNASSANGIVGVETVASRTMSPDLSARRPWMSRSRLSSLPEDRRVSKITSPTIRSARLLVYCLDQLNRPVDDAIRIIRSDSSRPSNAERLHVTATQNLKELDAQLHILTPMNESQAQESKDVRQILRRSRHCVQAYHQVVSDLRANAKKLILRGDPMYLRALMLQLHACLLEVRNACALQEQAMVPTAATRYSNVSQARSDRTITPTQPKPNPRRSRGAKIIAGMREQSPSSASYSGPLLSSASSRTTTMTSMSLATPRSNESFAAMNPSSRSSATTIASQFDSDEERQFEKIYLSLKQACELADHTLISCRQDFFVRKEGSARSMSSTTARAWTIALAKCDTMLHATETLKQRLGRIRLNDPSLRKSKEFWVTCDSFFNAYFDLASELKSLGAQGLDIGTIKPMMRPLQKAMKEGTQLIYSASFVRRTMGSTQWGGSAMSAAHTVPSTPLGAALGPAAQATVPKSATVMTGLVSPAEHQYNYRYDKDSVRAERERSDTVTSRYGNGYRQRS